jgi:hypothetical protein
MQSPILAREGEAARVAIEHSLACPKVDILECPNFWSIVNGVPTGAGLAEAHALGEAPVVPTDRGTAAIREPASLHTE